MAAERALTMALPQESVATAAQDEASTRLEALIDQLDALLSGGGSLLERINESCYEAALGPPLRNLYRELADDEQNALQSPNCSQELNLAEHGYRASIHDDC